MKVALLLLLLLNCLYNQAQPIEAKSPFEINGHKFKIEYYEVNDNFQIILSTKSGRHWITQLTDEVEIFGNVKFFLKDANNDQYLDLIVGFKGYPERKHLYLFDSKQNKYIEVDGYENYPDPKPVKFSSKYYYSYTRTGCDGRRWHSDLFYLDGFDVEVIGNIQGNGCGGADDVQVLKVRDKSKSKIATMSLRKALKPYDNGKYGFLANYWTQNLAKFKEE